ncbi:MAG: four helix bundle protein [Ignavibacteriales bacterium]|nr:four helix bundle protein [Ignavibacteriales bacterium]
MAPQKPQDIKERTFEFAVKIIQFAEHLPNSRSSHVLSKQLIRSGTSIGANVEEAVAASSKEDFVYKMNIALREARETNYWLRIIQQTQQSIEDIFKTLLQESEEIMKILGAIVSKARGKRKS